MLRKTAGVADTITVRDDGVDTNFDTNTNMFEKSMWYAASNSGQGTPSTGLNVLYRISGNPTATFAEVAKAVPLGGDPADGGFYRFSNDWTHGQVKSAYTEMIFFTGTLSQTDSETVQGYLTAKYDIPDS